LPPRKKKKKAGRPRMNDKKAMSAIFYVLRTGCQWKALPRSLSEGCWNSTSVSTTISDPCLLQLQKQM
jgi:transposase